MKITAMKITKTTAIKISDTAKLVPNAVVRKWRCSSNIDNRLPSIKGSVTLLIHNSGTFGRTASAHIIDRIVATINCYK